MGRWHLGCTTHKDKPPESIRMVLNKESDHYLADMGDYKRGIGEMRGYGRLHGGSGLEGRGRRTCERWRKRHRATAPSSVEKRLECNFCTFSAAMAK